MVKIVALRPFRGDEGFITPRSVIDVGERRAAELVRRGLATYEVGGRMVADPQNKMVPASKSGVVPDPAGEVDDGAAADGDGGAGAAAAVVDPTEGEHQAGSPTGRAARRSSSRAGRQRAKRK